MYLSAVGFSGYTLLVWDFLLTFDDEVKAFFFSQLYSLTHKYYHSLQVTHIWRPPWSIVKMIFLTNRYFNLVTLGIVNAQQAGLYRSTSPSVSRFPFERLRIIKCCWSFALISTCFLRS